jgi:uncharacterized alpha-E superfamily protein
MLSRVASHLYWMARYVERADNGARILEAESTLALDHGYSAADLWRAPLATGGELEDFKKIHGEPRAATALQFLLYAPENPNSIMSCITQARENARAARGILPADVTTALNRLYWQFREANAHRHSMEAAPAELLESVRFGCALVQGLCEASLSRGDSWHFNNLGRMLERAGQTSRLIDVKFLLMFPADTPEDATEEARWLALLRSSSALEIYRRLQGRIIPKEVARFLIFNSDFPRSFRRCLEEAQISLEALCADQPRADLMRRLSRLRSDFAYGDEESFLSQDLHLALDRFQAELNDIGSLVDDAFFNPSLLEAPQERAFQPYAEAQQQ